VIVFYAGDNDIDRGKSSDQVASDFKAFVAKVRPELPKTKIFFICIKPSIARWELVDQMRDVNRQIREIAEKDELLEYVDIDTPMLGPDGRPRKGLFLTDGLHLNDEGYAIWVSVLLPHLQAAKGVKPKGD
jgi:lysophospholipase L1-like esterase